MKNTNFNYKFASELVWYVLISIAVFEMKPCFYKHWINISSGGTIINCPPHILCKLFLGMAAQVWFTITKTLHKFRLHIMPFDCIINFAIKCPEISNNFQIETTLYGVLQWDLLAFHKDRDLHV